MRKAPPQPCLTISAPSSSIRILPWATGQWAATTTVSASQARASEYLTKAFQLREHASEREKLAITADYYSNVTGELDKAAQTYQEEIESYPRDSSHAYINLGIVYASRDSMRKLRRSRGKPAARTGSCRLVRQSRQLPTGLAAIRRSAADHPRGAGAKSWTTTHYSQCSLRSCLSRRTRLQWRNSSSGLRASPRENYGLALASDTEAYAGHLGKARELTKRAVDSAIRADSKENWSDMAGDAAQREAAYGNPAEARQAAQRL